jgi:hypothetical protein
MIHSIHKDHLSNRNLLPKSPVVAEKTRLRVFGVEMVEAVAGPSQKEKTTNIHHSDGHSEM